MDLSEIIPSTNYFVLSVDTTDIDYQPCAMIYGSPRETFAQRIVDLFESHYDAKVLRVELTEYTGYSAAKNCKVTLEEGQVMDHLVLLPGHQY